MAKKLVVHLGANKTGSSAIQKFLSLNCGTLRQHGLVIPDPRFAAAPSIPGFHVFGFEELFRDPDGGNVLESALARLSDEQADAHSILLSAENLAANQAAPALFSRLGKQFDIRLVLYVRRQDEYLLSSWQQWYSKISDDFWAWALRSAGQLGNWRTYLERWEQVVPRERITVRVFERSRLDGGDVVRDFYNLLGLDVPFESLAYPEAQVNPSFSDAIMDLVKGNPLVFRDVHDNDFYGFVQATTGDRHIKRGRDSAITFAQRMAFIEKYEAGNRWVQDRYLAGQKLFSVPRESDYDHSPGKDHLAEQLEFLAAAVYGTYKAKP